MRRRALASRPFPRALILAVMVSAVPSTGLVPIHRAEPVRAGTAEKAAVPAPTATPEPEPEDPPGPTSRLLLTSF